MTKQDLGDEEQEKQQRFGVRTLITGLVWASFVGYAFSGYAPGQTEAAKALDAELLTTIIANPFDDTIPSIFVAIFNVLGLMPFVYSCLVLPGSRDQSPPAAPFCVASFALGFFAIGPYLALRRFAPFPAPPKAQWLAKAIENKVAAVLALFSGVFLFYYAFAGGSGGLDLGKYVVNIRKSCAAHT